MLQVNKTEEVIKMKSIDMWILIGSRMEMESVTVSALINITKSRLTEEKSYLQLGKCPLRLRCRYVCEHILLINHWMSKISGATPESMALYCI